MPYTHKDVDVVVSCDLEHNRVFGHIFAGPYLISAPIVSIDVYTVILQRLVAFNIIDTAAHKHLLANAPHYQLPATYKEACRLTKKKLPLRKRLKHTLTERWWELKKAGRYDEVVVPHVACSSELLDGYAGCNKALGTFRYFIAFLDTTHQAFMTTHRGTVRDVAYSLKRLFEDGIISSSLYNRLQGELVRQQP